MVDPFEPTAPDRSQGLSPYYWFLKWLPDPPPDVRDAIVLTHIYGLAAALGDAKVSEEVRAPVASLLRQHVERF